MHGNFGSNAFWQPCFVHIFVDGIGVRKLAFFNQLRHRHGDEHFFHGAKIEFGVDIVGNFIGNFTALAGVTTRYFEYGFIFSRHQHRARKNIGFAAAIKYRTGVRDELLLRDSWQLGRLCCLHADSTNARISGIFKRNKRRKPIATHVVLQRRGGFRMRQHIAPQPAQIHPARAREALRKRCFKNFHRHRLRKRRCEVRNHKRARGRGVYVDGFD